jgi:PGF-CTERM protein
MAVLGPATAGTRGSVATATEGDTGLAQIGQGDNESITDRDSSRESDSDRRARRSIGQQIGEQPAFTVSSGDLSTTVGTLHSASGAGTRDETTAETAIDPALSAVDGTTSVVVRLADLDRQDLSSVESVTDALKRHASTTQQPLDSVAATTDAVTIERRFWLANAMVLEVDTDAVSIEHLAARPDVRAVHENFAVHALDAPVHEPATQTPTRASAASALDPADNVTYGLEQIDVRGAWNETRGAGASVAVLDTGVDTTAHPELAPIEGGWAEFDAGGQRQHTTPNDGNGHGTHVSGTVVGNRTSNGTAYGVAPDADLLHGKVLDDNGGGTFASVIAGMEWAVEHEADVDVISMSLGFSGQFAERMIEPVRNARAEGTAVVVSAGNDGAGTSASPGNVYEAVAVGASSQTGTIASFSSGETINTTKAWGDAAPEAWPENYTVPNVAAPGVDVVSASAGGGYRALNGTSMAAPHVAGTAALLASINQDVTPQGIENALESTAEKPSGTPATTDPRYGDGIINASAAVEAVVPSATIGGLVTTQGSLAEAVTVSSELGYSDRTDDGGRYELSVPPVEQNVTADAFGYEAVTKSVNPAEEKLTILPFSLDDPIVEAETTAAPDYVPAGETVTISHRVAHANVTTVDIVDSERTVPDNASLRIAGSEAEFGQPAFVGRGDSISEVNVTITTNTTQLSGFELRFTFSESFAGENATTTTTGPTRVHPETVVVPDDVDPGHTEGVPYTNLQDVIEFVVGGTTVQLNHSTFRADADVAVGADTNASIAVTKPLSIVATAEATPVIDVVDTPGANTTIGLVTTASGTTVSGLDIHGNGANTSVFNVGTNVTIENSSIRNSTTGLKNAGNGLTIRDTRFDNHTTGGTFLTGVGATVSNNTVTNVRTGIDVRFLFTLPPAVIETGIELSGTFEETETSLRQNHISNVSGVGIDAVGSVNQTIEGNHVVDAGTGIRLNRTNQTRLADNVVTGSGITVENATATTGIDNVIRDTATGLTITDGTQSTTLVGSRLENATDAVRIRQNSTGTLLRGVTVTSTDGTIEFGAVPSGVNTVTDAVLADGSTVTATGTNATLALNETPPSPPLADVGTFLELRSGGENTSLSTTVSYAESATTEIDDSTLQLYSYDEGWTPVGGSTVATDRRTVSGTLTSAGAFAPLGETAPPSDDESDEGDTGGGGGSDDSSDGVGSAGPLPPRGSYDDGDDDDGSGSPPAESPNTPTAKILVVPDTPTVGEQVRFSGAESTANESLVVAYDWTIGSEQFDGETITERFDSAGEVDVELTVTAANNERNTTTTTLTVEPARETSGDNERRDSSEGAGGGSESSGSSMPGFGVLVALIGLLLGIGAKAGTDRLYSI